jgi:hypothetical protein
VYGSVPAWASLEAKVCLNSWNLKPSIPAFSSTLKLFAVVKDRQGNGVLVTIAGIESILLMYLTRREQEEFVRSLESALWEVI